MAPKDGELVPGSLKAVVVETSTVSRVVVPPVPATSIVKVVGAVAPGAVTTVPESLTEGSVSEVATSVLVPPWVPVTLTWSPAKMVPKDGELVPGSLKAVVVETSTVTRVEAVAVSTQLSFQLPWLEVEPVPATSIVKVVGAVAPGAVTTVPDCLTAGSVTEVAASVL
jgi:hypothetical protein